MSALPVRRALLSVYNKTGLVEFARRLTACGVEIVSSGGTARHLTDAGIAVTAVSDVTGAPEMLGGRVKTLHPAIHGGVLADLRDPTHIADLEAAGVEPFELVVVNLYPFEETAAAGVSTAEIVEQIDIGGPTLIRAAAKNSLWVGVVTDPEQYSAVADAVEDGGLTAELRTALARRAFFRTAAYDAAIVAWMERGEELPQRMVLAVERVQELRYGENPHQEAAVYAAPFSSGWWRASRQLQGKAMSFNNYVDAESAWRLVHALPWTAVAVVKHTNACGAATAGTLVEAFTAAWACDPMSAFGSVIAVNVPVDGETAHALTERFVEVLVAPAVTDEARAELAARKNLRVLEAPAPHGVDFDLRRLEDGLLAQKRDGSDQHAWEVPSERSPSDAEIADLRFAWAVASHAKSNAVVLARSGAAVGVGAGDQSRVGAADRAIAKAGDRAVGAAAASDAFFPFRDGIDVLAAAGVTAVIEPGGSVRDADIVDAVDEHGMALVFTGRRHFLH